MDPPPPLEFGLSPSAISAAQAAFGDTATVRMDCTKRKLTIFSDDDVVRTWFGITVREEDAAAAAFPGGADAHVFVASENASFDMRVRKGGRQFRLTLSIASVEDGLRWDADSDEEDSDGADADSYGTDADADSDSDTRIQGWLQSARLAASKARTRPGRPDEFETFHRGIRLLIDDLLADARHLHIFIYSAWAEGLVGYGIARDLEREFAAGTQGHGRRVTVNECSADRWDEAWDGKF